MTPSLKWIDESRVFISVGRWMTTLVHIGRMKRPRPVKDPMVVQIGVRDNSCR